MRKKLLSIVLAITMVISMGPTTFAAEPPSNEMDTLDLIIAAGSYLNSSTQGEKCIGTGTFINNSVPLFRSSGDIVAYYVTFSPSGYAVVNNNVDNPDLLQNNSALAKQHRELKQSIMQEQSMTRGDGDYGFVDASNMPAGSYTSDTVLSATSTDWVTMDEFNSVANNHCGATAVTNFALHFAQRGSSNFTGIKTAIGKDRPCGILLADGLISWHWIMSVGYREYSNSSGYYMRIMDGWYDTVDRYYKLNTGSTWISATEYWV